MSIRVLIAEKERLFRQSLRVLLEQERDLTVVAEAADGREAFNLAMAHKPDLVLMDIDMPTRDGSDRHEADPRLLARHKGLAAIHTR